MCCCDRWSMKMTEMTDAELVDVMKWGEVWMTNRQNYRKILLFTCCCYQIQGLQPRNFDKTLPRQHSFNGNRLWIDRIAFLLVRRWFRCAIHAPATATLHRTSARWAEFCANGANNGQRSRYLRCDIRYRGCVRHKLTVIRQRVPSFGHTRQGAVTADGIS